MQRPNRHEFIALAITALVVSLLVANLTPRTRRDDTSRDVELSGQAPSPRSTPAPAIAAVEPTTEPSPAQAPTIVIDANDRMQALERAREEGQARPALGEQATARLRRGVTVAEANAAGRSAGFRVVRRAVDSDWVLIEALPGSAAGEALVARVIESGVCDRVDRTALGYPAATPNDPMYATQWGYSNTGQTGGAAGADGKFSSAWDYARGEGAVVAVTDVGIEMSHPDLVGKSWVNADEIAANGIDDDSNGYVDDMGGWDFFNGDATYYDKKDGDIHGTHVAGTIAAVTDNAIGVAGGGWDTRIMALKWLGPGGGTEVGAHDAIHYAVDNGARVINASWTFSASPPLLAEAIDYAASHGVLVIAAAGNNGVNLDATPFYPASYAATNVISVAALDHADARASFSNYSATSVDLGAPGVDVMSTVAKTYAALHVNHPTYEIVYAGFPVEKITDATTRQTLITRSMGELASSVASPVLVVDDSWGYNFGETVGARSTVLTNALAAAGYNSVTTWDTRTQGTPTAATMAGKVVVWFTGYSNWYYYMYYGINYTFGVTERTNLTTFLNAGGKLLLSSGETANDMQTASSSARDFLHNYLHAAASTNDPSGTNFDGLSGTLYDGLAATVSPGGSSALLDGIAPWDSYATSLGEWTPRYAYMSGTSMAAPHVSAALGLALSRSATITASDLKSRLLATADAVSALATSTVSGGRLDAAELVGTLGAPEPLSAWYAGTPGSLQLGWNDPTTLDYSTTRVLSRSDTEPAGPDDGSATVLYEGTNGTCAHVGAAPGETIHYAAFARNRYGTWSLAARLTTVVAPVPATGAPIPAGSNVIVSALGEVTVTFSEVSAPGWLYVSHVTPSFAPPTGFRFPSLGYFEVHPVGTFALPATITLHYPEADLLGPESDVRLYHHASSGWEDITTSIDTTANTVTGVTSSFSEFGTGEPVGPITEADAQPAWLVLLVVPFAAIAVHAAEQRRTRITHIAH